MRKHSNADRLQVGSCFGNSIIVGLDTKEGDVGIYFPTDGQLGIEYVTKNNLVRKKDENGNQVGGYLDPDKRNIITIKLRGEKSDGLFMPLSSLEDFCDISTLKEGDRVTILNGITICEKYIPHSNNPRRQPSSSKKKLSSENNLTKFPYFEEHVDTAQLVYNLNEFKPGDTCYITLKMHGTSARTSYTVEDLVKRQNVLQRLLHIKQEHSRKWDYVSGTRRVVLKTYDGGFYGSDEFRKKWNDFFVGKLDKGVTVYYEIVGYTQGSQLIMAECDNKKLKDEDFVRAYGDRTRFTYGCSEGENDAYIYRITVTNEDGFIVELPWEQVKLYCDKIGAKHVPEFEKFLFTTKEDLIERVEKYYDGTDPVGKTHVREGVVVRIDNKPKFTAYKHKNFEFKCLEGIIKSGATAPDMEEAQEVV